MKVQKGSSASAKVYVPTNTIKTGPNKAERQLVRSIESAAVPDAAADNVDNPENSDNNEEGTCSLFRLSYMLNFDFLFFFFL